MESSYEPSKTEVTILCIRNLSKLCDGMKTSKEKAIQQEAMLEFGCCNYQKVLKLKISLR